MIVAYPVIGKAKSKLICEAFLRGAPASAKGTVFFGTEGLQSQFNAARASGHPWFYCDNSYLDKARTIYFRATKSALQIDPLRVTRESDGKRFLRLGIDVKAERPAPSNGLVVLVPQSDQFMKSIGYAGDWTANTQKQLIEWGEENVYVHPWNRNKAARGDEFKRLLPRTRLVITHSSSAAITALLEGVPAISTSDTAAAHWIGGKFTQEHVHNPTLAPEAARVAFANLLAEHQFTLEEMRSGYAWEVLSR